MTVCRRSLLYPRRLSLCQRKLASCNWCAVFITRTGCAAHGCMRRLGGLCSSALSSWVHRRDTTRVHRTDLTLICKQAVCRRNRTELTTSSKLRTLNLTNYEVLRGSARRQSVQNYLPLIFVIVFFNASFEQSTLQHIRPCYAKSSYRLVDPQTLHGNVHQVDPVPNGPTNSAAITTMFPLRLCGGKL